MALLLASCDGGADTEKPDTDTVDTDVVDTDVVDTDVIDTEDSGDSDTDIVANCTVFDGDVVEDNLASVCAAGGPVCVTGSVTLEDVSNADLGQLSCIVSIDVELGLYGGDATDLDALGALTSVDWLTLEALPELAQIQGLAQLSDVGNVAIYETGLPNVDGLSALTEVPGILALYDNPNLAQIDGLSSVHTVGSLYLEGNPALTNLDGLSSLISADTVQLQALPLVADLNGLSALQSVTRLVLWEVEISDLTGLVALIEPPESIEIFDCDQMQSLGGLEGYETLGGLWIDGNVQLQDLDALSDLTAATGYLRFENSAVTDWSGLSGLTTANGLILQGNDGLLNVDALSSLTTVPESLAIGGNPGLLDLDGLHSLTAAGELFISSNPALANVDGLYSLTATTGNVIVSDNDLLTHVDGFSALTTIGGSLQVDSNAALLELDGFSSVTSVTTIVIIDNDVLASLDGLFNATADGVYIHDNAGFSDADAQALATEVGAQTVNIGGNGL